MVLVTLRSLVWWFVDVFFWHLCGFVLLFCWWIFKCIVCLFACLMFRLYDLVRVCWRVCVCVRMKIFIFVAV